MKSIRLYFVSLLVVLMGVSTLAYESPQEHFLTSGATLTQYVGSGGDVVIPAVIDGVTITRIDELAFHQAPIDSVVIPGSITTIDGWAFYDCNQLQSLVIEEGVTTIGEVAFYYCENLTYVQLPESLTKIEDEAFAYCTSLIEITLPSTALVTLGYGVFHGCDSLQSIVIPDSVTSLGNWAFYHCINLREVTLSGNIRKLDDGVFARCISLAELTIPEGVTTISTMAFFGSYGLKQVFFPSTVTKMEEYLFADGESIIEPESNWGNYNVVLWGTEGSVVESYAQGENLIFLQSPTTRSFYTFEDVNSSDWFVRGVTFASNYQLMSGDENYFYPNDPATRGMTAEAFALLSGEELWETTTNFGDVDEYYASFVAWCQNNGVMSGYSEDYFALTETLTREQFATILSSFSKYKELYQEVDKAILGNFLDVGDISTYAMSPLAWAVEQGLFVGYEGNLNPKNPVTRAEVATVLLSFYGNILT